MKTALFINQYFSHYETWEDYKNGMYSIEKKENEQQLVNNAIILLSDNNMFYEICKELLLKWTVSSKVNLTNKQCNRKAWLGQAACNLKFNVPEILTRVAWGQLSISKRYCADDVALKIINHFELSYENKNTKLYF